MEGTLSQDVTTLFVYLQTWRLKLSYTKAVTATFYLNNREVKCGLSFYNSNKILPFCPTPTNLWDKTGLIAHLRSPTSSIAKKLSLRVVLLRRLTGSGWGADAKTLRSATLSLVYSTAKYCTLLWCQQRLHWAYERCPE